MPSKKNVSFSSQLERVRYFRGEEPPMNVRRLQQEKHHSATISLPSSSLASASSSSSSFTCILQPSFIIMPEDVPSRTTSLKVSLESVSLNANSSLQGSILVANLAFSKRVFMRLTNNSWASSQDIMASFVEHQEQHNMDRFSFSLPLSSSVFPSSGASTSLEFCLGFECEGNTYWDNNFQKNYQLSLLKKYEERKEKEQPKDIKVMEKETLGSEPIQQSSSSYETDIAFEYMSPLLNDIRLRSCSSMSYSFPEFLEQPLCLRC